MDAVIDGLEKPSEHEQLSALHRLRVSVSEHGSLQVDNVPRLFQLLHESLLDSHGVDASRRVAVECLRLLCEIVPTCGVDVEMRFAALLPALVSALGDDRTQRCALNLLDRLLAIASTDGGASIFGALVRYGMEGSDARVQKEAAVALAHLLQRGGDGASSANYAIDYCAMLEALATMLSSADDARAFAAEAALEAVQRVDPLFDEHEQQLSSRVRQLLTERLERSASYSSPPSYQIASHWTSRDRGVMAADNEKGRELLLDASFTAASDDGRHADTAVQVARRGQERVKTPLSASSPPLTPPHTAQEAPDLAFDDVPALPASVVLTELKETQHQPHQHQRHNQHRGVRFADASSSPVASNSVGAPANTVVPPEATGSVPPPLVYGFLPLRVLEALTQGEWKVRALAIDELRALVTALLESGRASVVFGHEGKLLLLLAELLEDPNFKITISTLKTLGDVLDLLRNVLSPAEHLPLFFPTLLGRLGDSKIVIRQQCAKVLSRLMSVLGTDSVLPRFTTALEHENWHVREESLKLMMVGFLRPSGATLPLGEMQALLVDELVPLLIVDTNENVRHAALEMVAVLDYVGGEALEVAATLRGASTVPSDILGHVLMRLSQPALPGVNTEGILEYGLLNRHGGKGRSANGRSLLQEADASPSELNFGSPSQNKSALAPLLPSSSASTSASASAAVGSDGLDDDIVFEAPSPLAFSTQSSAPSSRSKRDSPVRGVVHSGLAKKKIPWELDSTNGQPTQFDMGIPYSPIRPAAGGSGQGGAQSAPRSASKVALWLPASEHSSDSKLLTPPPNGGPALQTLASDPGPARRHRSHHAQLAYEAPRSPRVPSPKHPSRRISGVDTKAAHAPQPAALTTPAPKPTVSLDVMNHNSEQWRDRQLQGQWHGGNSSSGAEYVPSWHTHSSNGGGLASGAGSNTGVDAVANKDVVTVPAPDRRKRSPPTVSINLHSEHSVQSSPSSSYTPKQLYHHSEMENKGATLQTETFPMDNPSDYRSASTVSGIGSASQISLQQTQAHWPPLATSADDRPSGQPQPIIRSRLGLLKSKQENRKRLPSRHSRSANPSANLNTSVMSGTGRGYDQTLHAPMTPLETGMYDERGERQQTLTSQSTTQSSNVHATTTKASSTLGDERPIRPMQNLSYEEAAAWQSKSDHQQQQPQPHRRGDERPIRPMKNASYEEAAAWQSTSDQQQQPQPLRRSQRQKARGRVSAATLRKRERQAAATSANETVLANEFNTVHGHRPGAVSDAGAGGGGGGGSGIAGRAVSQAEYLCSDELEPLDQPERALSTAFRCISQSHKEVEWFDVFDSLNHIRALAVHHPQVLCRERPVSLHDLVLALLRQVDNLRSAIAKNALLAMVDLFRGLRNAMDSELPSVVPYLLKRASDTNGFLIESAEAALDAMSVCATPSRSLNALLSSASSKLSTTRVKTAETIEATAAAVGSSRLAQFRELPRLLVAVARFMDDANQETRGAGKRTMVRLVREGVVSMQQLQRTLTPADLRKVQTLLDREQHFTSSATGFVVTNAPHGGGGGSNSRIASDPGVRRGARN